MYFVTIYLFLPSLSYGLQSSNTYHKYIQSQQRYNSLLVTIHPYAFRAKFFQLGRNLKYTFRAFNPHKTYDS